MKNLKLLRDEKGISQQKVADAVGSNQQSIHRYENGDYEPDIQTLSLIADYFDTSVDFLIGRTDIRRKIESFDKFDLNREEAYLVSKYRGLPTEYKKCLSKMLDALIDMADGNK